MGAQVARLPELLQTEEVQTSRPALGEIRPQQSRSGTVQFIAKHAIQRVKVLSAKLKNYFAYNTT